MSAGRLEAPSDRRLRLDVGEKEIWELLDAEIRERRTHLALDHQMRIDEPRFLFNVVDLVQVARALQCAASDLLATLHVAEYQRTPPEPTYDRRRGGFSPTPPLDHDVATSETPAAIRLRIGHELRSHRRQQGRRPLHLLARDAGMTLSTLLTAETGRSTVSITNLVHITDSYEVRVAAILLKAGL